MFRITLSDVLLKKRYWGKQIYEIANSTWIFFCKNVARFDKHLKWKTALRCCCFYYSFFCLCEMSPCFEMILTCLSDIYELFKSITLFPNSMWKSWLLITKLGVRIALVHHLHHQLWISVNKRTYCFGTGKTSVKNEFENQ